MPNIFSSRKRRWRKRNKILQTFLILSTFPLLSNFFFDRIFCSALITWLPCKHRHLYPGGVFIGYPIHRVCSGRAELSSSQKTLQTLWLPWRRTRWEKLKIDVSHFFEDQHWGRSSSSSISSSRIDFQGGWGVARLQAACTAKKGAIHGMNGIGWISGWDEVPHGANY